MSNVFLDGIDLSTYGLAVLGIQGRGVPALLRNEIQIPGSQRNADMSEFFDQSELSVTGMLSADVTISANYTHQGLLQRFNSLKSFLNPKLGFRKLQFIDDQTNDNRYRYVRLSAMDWTEQFPVFKLPFQQISLGFECLEPYWRVAQTPVILTQGSFTPTASVPNIGDEPSKPLIVVTVGSSGGAEIAALTGTVTTPVTVFAIDDLQVNWSGGPLNKVLNVGDVLNIDSEAMVVTVDPVSAPSYDATACYEYAGPGAYITDGFPSINESGSVVSQLHPAVSSMEIDYEALCL